MVEKVLYLCQMKPVDPEARRIALSLLAKGLITISEAKELCGVSRQLMLHWVQRRGVDWRRIRWSKLTALWRKEAQRGPKLVEVEKSRSSHEVAPR